MPDPFERHGKSDGWGPMPPRSQQRAAAAAGQLRAGIEREGKRPPGRKDPDLCKAAHWKGPHRPQVVRHDPFPGRMGTCEWDVSWSGDKPCWSCCHEEECSGCGKVLRTRIGEQECPQWHPVTEAERTAVDAEIVRHREIRAARAERRPAITGPQGYRRRRTA